MAVNPIKFVAANSKPSPKTVFFNEALTAKRTIVLPASLVTAFAHLGGGEIARTRLPPAFNAVIRKVSS